MDTFNFTLRHVRIAHPEWNRANDEIKRIHSRGLNTGSTESMAMVSPSGVGKSTLLRAYADAHPRYYQKGSAVIPVLYLVVPEVATVKSLTEAFARALGHPFPRSGGSSFSQTARITDLIAETKVELVLIDEFQHFDKDGHAADRRDVADWLKNFLETCQIPFVLAGMPNAISVVYRNAQLKRRLRSLHIIHPFGFETEDAQLAFRGILKQLHSKVPVKAVEFHSPDIARRFHFASNGIIDYVIKIIDDAVSRCENVEGSSIGLKDLQDAFVRQVWFNAPTSLNPFSLNAQLRRLNQYNEPFYGGHDLASLAGPIQPAAAPKRARRARQDVQ